MSTSLGVTSVETQAFNNLVAGDIETATVTLKIGATPTIGQVLIYETETESYLDFTAFNAGDILAVFADTILHDADGVALEAAEQCTVIVGGRVNLSALDAVAQADPDIIAALRENGIFAQAAIIA